MLTFKPVPAIYKWADTYLEAAEILESHATDNNTDLYRVAIINAALAIELYLKSFTGEIDSPGKGDAGYKASGGHSLIKLYNKIEPKARKEIDSIYSTITIETNQELSIQLNEFSSYFTQGRYAYELSSAGPMDSRIIELAKALKTITKQIKPYKQEE